jgi:hypothetical protein
MFSYVPIKHKQMSFVSNGGKFKLYTVLNGLIFPRPTQPRISFERAILGLGRIPCAVSAYKKIQTQHFLFVINTEHFQLYSMDYHTWE